MDVGVIFLCPCIKPLKKATMGTTNREKLISLIAVVTPWTVFPSSPSPIRTSAKYLEEKYKIEKETKPKITARHMPIQKTPLIFSRFSNSLYLATYLEIDQVYHIVAPIII